MTEDNFIDFDLKRVIPVLSLLHQKGKKIKFDYNDTTSDDRLELSHFFRVELSLQNYEFQKGKIDDVHTIRARECRLDDFAHMDGLEDFYSNLWQERGNSVPLCFDKVHYKLYRSNFDNKG